MGTIIFVIFSTLPDLYKSAITNNIEVISVTHHNLLVHNELFKLIENDFPGIQPGIRYIKALDNNEEDEEEEE